eukprot:7586220-Pyramimonas_sp.AAC.1
MVSTIVPAVIALAKLRLLARTECFFDGVDPQTTSQAKTTPVSEGTHHVHKVANMRRLLVSAVRLQVGQPALVRG